jgi:hypothetical protein
LVPINVQLKVVIDFSEESFETFKLLFLQFGIVVKSIQ